MPAPAPPAAVPAAPPSAATEEPLHIYRALKAAEPKLRARDIAERMGLSEGALAELRTDTGETRGEVRRLALRGGDFLRLLEDLRRVGPVMTLCRNDAAVHETTGTIEQVQGTETMGQVVGPIDLRLFLRHWQAGYEIAEETRSGLRRSFQIFDTTGRALLKIYGVGGTNWNAWASIAERHADRTTALTSFSPPVPAEPDRPDNEIDIEALRAGWHELEHSHDFHKLLRECGVGRAQALRLAGEDLAKPLEPGAIAEVLRGAAARGVPIMCFVGNVGCLQIFSGTVHRIEPMGPWINVLDEAFNLHLRTDRVASAWRVVKPTSLRGEITSLELFDAEGALIAQLFGQRPPGDGERPEWRALMSEVAA